MRPYGLVPLAALAAMLASGCQKAPETTPPVSSTPPPMPGGGPPVPAPVPSPTGPAKADAAAGKIVFAANCKGCHGATGAGVIKGAPNFSSIAWQKRESDDADLLKSIHNGKGRMPAWKGRLTEKQMTDALAYIRTLGVK